MSDSRQLFQSENLLHRHLLMKMDPTNHHGDNYSQQKCESPSPRIKRKIGTEELTSHRLIEKRRRDRMNSCLADLSRLIPSSYLKKGRGRVEKTEIVQMAIKYIRQLQQSDNTGTSQREATHYDAATQTTDQNGLMGKDSRQMFLSGYNECFEETIQFLVEREQFPESNQVSSRLYSHLSDHFEEMAKTKGKNSVSHRKGQISRQTVDSDYNSLTSDTSSVISDWSSNSFSSKSLASASTMSSQNKNGSGQYKFKVDMRDRFHFNQEGHQQHQLHEQAQPEHQMGCGDDDDQKIRDQDWNLVWPLKRRQHLISRSGSQSENSSSPNTSLHQLQEAETHNKFGSNPSPPNLWSKAREAFTANAEVRSTRSQNGEREPSTSTGHSGHSHSRQHTQESTLFSKKSIPIFALHPNGSFYIPLVVNFAVLAPYMFMSPTEATLHPVTISVNFCTKPMVDTTVLPLPDMANVDQSKPFLVDEEKFHRHGFEGGRQRQQRVESRSEVA